MAQAPDPKIVTDTHYRPGTISHFVAFKVRSGVTLAQKRYIAQQFLALKRKCLRSGRPYIISLQAGAANSHEGVDQGKELGFIVTFKSEGDRNFYVGAPYLTDLRYLDPDHAKFKNLIASNVPSQYAAETHLFDGIPRPLLDTPIGPNGVFVFDFAARFAR